MANDGEAMRKELTKRGYRVEKPTGRGRTSYRVFDPKSGELIARFPSSPSMGSWDKNLRAAIRRYERTGEPARSVKARQS